MGRRMRALACFLGLVVLLACAERPQAESPSRPPLSAKPVAVAPVAPPAPTRAQVTETTEAPPAWPPSTPPAVETDWCTESVRALDATTCYFLPSKPTRTLLVYLHGVVPPEKTSAQKTHYQAVVARASERAGAAAVMPRGNQGLTPKGTEGWWGWPTSPGTYQRHGAELVLRIQKARRDFEQATGVRFERIYLAGSSSGAYFVATLAQRGDIEAHGFGAMSGGTRVLSPRVRELPPRPVYIGYGLYDTVGKAAKELAQVLEAAHWPVRVAEHRVGHGAKEIYLDEAFPFWAEHAR